MSSDSTSFRIEIFPGVLLLQGKQRCITVDIDRTYTAETLDPFSDSAVQIVYCVQVINLVLAKAAFLQDLVRTTVFFQYFLIAIKGICPDIGSVPSHEL